MEYKDFFDVFPDLKLKKNIKELFRMVKVRKVTRNRQGSSFRIYIYSNRLIPKWMIYEVEHAIENQILNVDENGTRYTDQEFTAHLMEEYELSKQYDAKQLFHVYKESLELEIHQYSRIMYGMFKSAKAEFQEEDHLVLSIGNALATDEKAKELRELLEKIFFERCHIPLTVDCKLTPMDLDAFEEENKIKIHNEIKQITKALPKRKEKKEVAAETKEAASEPAKKPENKGWEGKAKDGKKTFVPRPLRRSEDPDIFYGKDVDGEEIEIKSIVSEMGEVVIKGKIFQVDSRAIRNEKTILMFAVTDFTDSIKVKMFVRNDQLPEIEPQITKGKFVKIKGITMVDKFDGEVTISSVTGIKNIGDFTSKRIDAAVKKRVELHCHTKMSDMDGVSYAKDIIKRAIDWGHKAIAITDHGCVQGFTDAFHAIQKFEGDYKKKGEKLDFKIIYGLEAYLVDDIKDVVTNAKGQSLQESYVVFDIETTGFSPLSNKIIEIGAVKVENGEIVDRFETFVNPKVPIPFRIEQLTSINDSMVIDAPTIEEVLPKFLDFAKGSIFIAHNADFDMGFIKKNAEDMGLDEEFTYGDTVGMARYLLPTISKYTLDHVAKTVGVSLEHHHRAVDDAECTALIFKKFIEMFAERDITNLDQINEQTKASPQMVKKMPTYHAIILATTDIGRINLYRLVSHSHIDYYARRPRIPKSDFIKYRDGLLLGSACEAGELYRALLDGKSEKQIARIVNFYDYLEIQPLGNNKFMVESDKYSIESMEDIKNLNRKIVALGKQFHKPVVATCDVHFLDPEDEVYRRIIMAGKGFSDADDQGPLYLRTTEEMLKEFEYLGSDTAYEIVVENTSKIADMCEKIEPVRPDKCPPVIPNSDETLRKICYDHAHKMYGPDLPKIVEDRLEHELHSIIKNGFAVMYIIAQKLVWKSNEDGYLVGSRGSVGSSLVATMAGITEVNPLPPHYYCKKCHYSDFESDTVKAHTGGAGCDLPDKKCPVCGEPLIKDGFDIPFETFLGFYGDKEPDIDLNFSGEYQSKAHAYTEVIFGKGQTFRAGTIGTLAEKTAYGYVKKYYEERGDRKRGCEIERIVEGCTGIRRTTGQHPGGIIVLPLGEDINSFTPVQHPANDMTTSTITTHFDYHSIDHNLLKLDILGHDDPSIIRMLQDITGIDPLTIPLDDKEVMSLFKSPKALGVTPEDLRGCPLGALGIPEFGTDFSMQMVIDAKPEKFADLVRISGLSHGTDVWLNNAQTLIQEGKATISTCICTRDDIMIYLINKGVEAGLSFKIMESVRKGRGLTDEQIAAMKEKDVPDWYIDSCLKIKYMFPKAHAAAYVMMAFRIAWFKINYPLAYYAAYFSIRAKSFDYELMCLGKEKLEFHMDDYEKRAARKELAPVEEGQYKDMKLVQEMYARGFEFEKIDIYKVNAHRFQIVNGKLMASLDVIGSLGEKAADAVVEAAKDGPFLSKDDFRQRTKVGKTTVDMLCDLGILEGLPETNQLSLFDM